MRLSVPTVTKLPWPTDPLDQLAAILEVVQEAAVPLDADTIAKRFRGARKKRMAQVLERLADRRLLILDDEGLYLSLR